MKSSLSLRSVRRAAWLALLVFAPAVAGPGATITTLALLASLDGDHTHHVSIQQDVGHQDFVICHDARDDSDRSESAFAPVDCADDYRLHAARAASLVSRHQGSELPDAALFALVAAPLTGNVVRARPVLPAASPATQGASRHHRTIVLRL